MQYSPEVEKNAQDAVSQLMESDDTQLLEQLGLRARAMSQNPSIAGSFMPAVAAAGAQMGAKEDLQVLGQMLFKRWNKEVHTLLCGGDPTAAQDRQSLITSFGVSDVAVAGVMAMAMTSTLGVAPAIASIVATLIIKRFFRPTMDEFCKFWGMKIAEADQAQPSPAPEG